MFLRYRSDFTNENMTLLGLHLHFQGFLSCVSKSYHVNWQRPQNAKGEAQVVSKIRIEAPSLKKCDSNLTAPLHPKKCIEMNMDTGNLLLQTSTFRVHIQVPGHRSQILCWSACIIRCHKYPNTTPLSMHHGKDVEELHKLLRCPEKVWDNWQDATALSWGFFNLD